MRTALPGKFANRQLRPTKRRLSVYEKGSLQTTEGRALILPGDPNTEVEELTQAGYDACRIFGVEREPKIYEHLRNHYHDSANIFHADVFEWMARAQARGQYSYIHLDFCGHFQREQAVGVQNWTHLAAPISRVRVSIFRGRRSPLQFDWEEQMQDDLLVRWCELGYDMDTVDPDRWVTFHDHLQDENVKKDTTCIVIALMALNFTFGITDFREYVDECRENGAFLPAIEGTHRIANVNRWTYNEPGSPNYMYTVWADLEPLPQDPLRTSTQWTLDQLAQVFQHIDYHIPVFNHT